jgi:pimeloyl-ACP methyl ester carboxylesterase
MVVRLSVFASLLMCLVVSSTVTSAPSIREIEVNGMRLSYVDEGSGEPIVFVHGAFSDLRVWEPIREEVAKRYRFIAYTQRYFGTDPWPDDGKNFNIETHADDLAKFITSLNAGPVHLVTRSLGGGVAMAAALKNPALVRTLTLHEPALLSVLPADSTEGKAAREDRSKFISAAIAANKAGDPNRTTRLFFEGVYQLGPGGFDRLPEATRAMLLDNARTAPLLFGAPTPPPITCDALKTFTRPTLVTHGEKTHAYYKLINEGVSKCVPGAQQVSFSGLVHNAPSADPAAFTAALFEFMSKRQGL